MGGWSGENWTWGTGRYRTVVFGSFILKSKWNQSRVEWKWVYRELDKAITHLPSSTFMLISNISHDLCKYVASNSIKDITSDYLSLGSVLFGFPSPPKHPIQPIFSLCNHKAAPLSENDSSVTSQMLCCCCGHSRSQKTQSHVSYKNVIVTPMTQMGVRVWLHPYKGLFRFQKII